MMLRACVLLLVGVVAMITGQEQEQKCFLDSDVTVDERPKQEKTLHILDSLVGQSFVADVDGQKYTLALCADVVRSHLNTTIVSKDKNGKLTSLGLRNRTLVTSDEHWIMLSFLGGEKYEGECLNSTKEGRRVAHVMFLCDHNVKQTNLMVLDDSSKTLNCALTFAVRHRVVCYLSDPGLGGWSIFFIILLVSFGGYFCFGFFYMRMVKGAKGVEQIPNRTFWFKTGNLMADGCGAVFRCDRYCGVPLESGGGVRSSPSTGSYSGYSPIEEQLAQDLQEADRDSTLLSP